MGYNNNSSDGLEFRQIVLTQENKILEIGNSELRDTTREVIRENHTSYIESENTGVSYIQAIEGLAILLIPYYDKKMQEVYDECEIYLNGFTSEIEKSLPSNLEGMYEKTSDKKTSLLSIRIRFAKKLLIELNHLLKRVDYLRTAVFGEADDNVIEDMEDAT